MRDQQYTFTQSLVQYQYPLEAAIQPDRRQLSYSIRKAYPARQVHVPMFWALLTSSGECKIYLSTLPYMSHLKLVPAQPQTQAHEMHGLLRNSDHCVFGAIQRHM